MSASSESSSSSSDIMTPQSSENGKHEQDICYIETPFSLPPIEVRYTLVEASDALRAGYSKLPVDQNLTMDIHWTPAKDASGLSKDVYVDVQWKKSHSPDSCHLNADDGQLSVSEQSKKGTEEKSAYVNENAKLKERILELESQLKKKSEIESDEVKDDSALNREGKLEKFIGDLSMDLKELKEKVEKWEEYEDEVEEEEQDEDELEPETKGVDYGKKSKSEMHGNLNITDEQKKKMAAIIQEFYGRPNPLKQVAMNPLSWDGHQVGATLKIMRRTRSLRFPLLVGDLVRVLEHGPEKWRVRVRHSKLGNADAYIDWKSFFPATNMDRCECLLLERTCQCVYGTLNPESKQALSEKIDNPNTRKGQMVGAVLRIERDPVIPGDGMWAIKKGDYVEVLAHHPSDGSCTVRCIRTGENPKLHWSSFSGTTMKRDGALSESLLN